jgi:hypothetical protein
VGNAALSHSVVQAARAEILRLQTEAQIEAAKATVRAAKATIKTAAYTRRMVFWMLMSVVVAVLATAANLITGPMHH